MRSRPVTLGEFYGTPRSGVVGAFFALLACAFLACEIAAVVVGVLGGAP